MADIQKIGTVHQIDQSGNLVRVAKISNIHTPWSLVVEDIKETYLNRLGEQLCSLYVRGSVALGTAIEYVSDIDMIAIVSCRVDALDLSWKNEYQDTLSEKYNFCNGFDLEIRSMVELFDGLHPALEFTLKILSACVYGEDLSGKIQSKKPGKDSVIVARWFNKKHLESKITELSNPDITEVTMQSKWLAKHILRLSFELVMERDQTYTRDLYYCYEIFSKYYPEKKEDMGKVIEIAINQTNDKDELLKMLTGIGMWVANEAEKSLL